MSKHIAPRRLGVPVLAALTAGLLVSGCLSGPGVHAGEDDAFVPCEPPYDGPLHCVPDAAGKQFVWPVTAWIAANHQYYSGTDHHGSADLAAHLNSVVRPARPGVISDITYEQAEGWRVDIEHQGDDGDVYISSYGHLREEPTATTGDRVGLDDEIGRLGRLGAADYSGPHIHFYIAKIVDSEEKPVRIPRLELGDWAQHGGHIQGMFAGLEPIDSPAGTQSRVEVAEDELRAYETTDRQGDEVVATLTAGAAYDVRESQRGQYRVEINGQKAWIPLSGIVPEETELSGVVTTASPGKVRAGPGQSHEVIGTVEEGSHLTSYPRPDADGWRLVLWRCDTETNRSDDPSDPRRSLAGCHGLDPGKSRWKYGWIGPDAIEDTTAFDARSRVEDLAVYANRTVDGQDRPDPDDRIGSAGDFAAAVDVRLTRNGWYQIDFDGDVGWVRGWYTAGRQ